MIAFAIAITLVCLALPVAAIAAWFDVDWLAYLSLGVAALILLAFVVGGLAALWMRALGVPL